MPTPTPIKIDVQTARPLNDYVLLQELETDNISSGGIITPDKTRSPCAVARVIAAGPGYMLAGVGVVPLESRPGDIVLYHKECGYPIPTCPSYRIIKAEDIYATIRRESESK